MTLFMASNISALSNQQLIPGGSLRDVETLAPVLGRAVAAADPVGVAAAAAGAAAVPGHGLRPAPRHPGHAAPRRHQQPPPASRGQVQGHTHRRLY